MTAMNPTLGWQAELHLGFEQQAERTVLRHRRQRGPLAVQRPFYPEGEVCHAYILHPPGGVVGGDSLNLTLQVAGAALLTTPGATKFYRSAGPLATLHQQFTLTTGSLEWLPQENIYFPGAQVQLHQQIHLSAEAAYLGWEIHCLGRPAIAERFTHGGLNLHTALYRAGRPLLLERFMVQTPADLSAAAGLRDYPVLGTLLATPAATDLRDLARPLCVEVREGIAGVTLLNGVLVVRYLSHNTAEVHRLFRALWVLLRPALTGRAAVQPRIWHT